MLSWRNSPGLSPGKPPNVAISAVCAAAGAALSLWVLNANEPTPFQNSLAIVTPGLLVLTTWYSLLTCRRLVHHRSVNKPSHVLKWTFALAALVVNVYLLFIAAGIAMLVLIGRPIVS